MIEPPHADDGLGSPRLGIFVCDMVAGARYEPATFGQWPPISPLFPLTFREPIQQTVDSGDQEERKDSRNEQTSD